jgi:DNA-binding MarR family transcriptional regulator
MAPTPIYQLIWQTRRLFQRLRTVSEVLMENTVINAPQRAVLEFVVLKAPQTVQQIAQFLSVSRQHVQVIVNELLELELLEAIENPAHKRSPLIKVNNSGKKLFKTIQTREAAALKNLEGRIPAKDIATTIKTLKALDEYLASSEINSGN